MNKENAGSKRMVNNHNINLTYLILPITIFVIALFFPTRVLAANVITLENIIAPAAVTYAYEFSVTVTVRNTGSGPLSNVLPALNYDSNVILNTSPIAQDIALGATADFLYIFTSASTATTEHFTATTGSNGSGATWNGTPAGDTIIESAIPTAVPTTVDTAVPTAVDTAVPTAVNTAVPTAVNTAVPTAVDTAVPTA